MKLSWSSFKVICDNGYLLKIYLHVFSFTFPVVFYLFLVFYDLFFSGNFIQDRWRYLLINYTAATLFSVNFFFLFKVLEDLWTAYSFTVISCLNFCLCCIKLRRLKVSPCPGETKILLIWYHLLSGSSHTPLLYLSSKTSSQKFILNTKLNC